MWASIFFKVDKSDNVSISAGMFDGKTKLKTFRNIFVGSKSDFYQINDKLQNIKDLLNNIILRFS